MANLLKTTCLMLALVGPASADVAVDQGILQSVESGATADIPFVRCGAFYYAHLWWDSSRPMLSDEERSLFDANMNTALTQANIVRSEQNSAGVDAINEGIKADLRPFIVAYIKRFEKNFGAAGGISDELIEGDRSFCDDFVSS